jgi:hypothetical protein
VKCMVCCFLRHGLRYETVECTQDMHNEHRNEIKPQKKEKAGAVLQRSHFEKILPISEKGFLVGSYSTIFCNGKSVLKTAAVCSLRKRTPTVDQIAGGVFNYYKKKKPISRKVIIKIFFRITVCSYCLDLKMIIIKKVVLK